MEEITADKSQYAENSGIVSPQKRATKLQELAAQSNSMEIEEESAENGPTPEYELFQFDEYGRLDQVYESRELYQDRKLLAEKAKLLQERENSSEELDVDTAAALIGIPRNFNSYQLNEYYQKLTDPYGAALSTNSEYLNKVFGLLANDITTREIQEMEKLSQGELDAESQQTILRYFDYFLGTPSNHDLSSKKTIRGSRLDFSKNPGIPYSFLKSDTVECARSAFLEFMTKNPDILSRVLEDGQPLLDTWSSLRACIEAELGYRQSRKLEEILHEHIEKIGESGVGPEIYKTDFWDVLTIAAEKNYLSSDELIKFLDKKDTKKGEYKASPYSTYYDNPDFYERRLLAATAMSGYGLSEEYYSYIQKSLSLEETEINCLDKLIRYYNRRSFYSDGGQVRDRDKTVELGETDIMMVLQMEKKLPGSVSKLEKEFGIKNFGRYSLDSLLEQAKEDDTDSPYGIVLYPYADWNGAFHQRGLFIRLEQELKKYGTKVRFAEAGSKIDLARRMITFNKKYGSKNKMSFAILGGHGTQSSIQFGERYYEESSTLPELSLSDITGKGIQRAASGEFFEEGATIILKSCSTGAKEGIAQEISKVTSGEVIGPEKSTALRDIEVREVDGKLVFDVTYNDADSNNYVGGEHQTDRTIAPPKGWR